MPQKKFSKKSSGPSKLKQRLFVEAYLMTGNATEAARRAGYKGTDEALAVTGHRTLRNAKVQNAIRNRMAEAQVASHEVIGTLASHQRGDITDFLDDDGRFDLSVIRQRGLGHLIKSIIVRQERNSDTPAEIIKIELYNA